MFFDGQYQRCDELDRIDRGELPAQVSLPWEAVKRYVKHIHTGMLTVIAAETSVGKTTAIECCAEHWARQGLHVALFHLELSHRFMMDRRMARQSGETLETIESGEVTDRMREADERMRTWRGAIHYVHCPGWSAYQIVQKARQLNARGLCDVMIVDYLQKLRLGFRNGENKADAIGNAVEGIKNGLEQMGIAGLLASQFSRRSNAQSRKTADLIRGSGEVEEKTNIVITLDRDILTSEIRGPQGNIIAYPGERSPQVKVRVDKNTAGPTGDCELVMNGARFLMLDKTTAKNEPPELIF
ncbi:MAG: DnaB-like helicase C-terminal domain-containing protein [Pseudomonadota bacterium]